MKQLDEFRIFYNHTIHPELWRMERQRRRLLRLLVISMLLLIGLVVLQFYINLLLITLTISIPIAIYIGWLYLRIRKFIRTFKPNVVELVLDFTDNSLNYQEMKYQVDGKLDIDIFRESRLFATPAHVYEAEDYITGQIGNIKFELCELDVKEISPVRDRLDDVFKGIFLYAHYDITPPPEGKILIWPRKKKQFHTRAIKNFTAEGGKNIDGKLLSAPFVETFTTYATQDSDVPYLLNTEMQHAIFRYHERSERDMYMSILGNKIYVFLTQEKDILEPELFRPNVSYELVREFFEDIQLIVSVVEDLDRFY